MTIKKINFLYSFALLAAVLTACTAKPIAADPAVDAGASQASTESKLSQGATSASRDASVVSSNPDHAQAIVGLWSYERKHQCAPSYIATLKFNEVSGYTARGEWYSFGNKREWEGVAMGRMRGDRWYLRFCYAKDKKMDHNTCPDFGPEQVYVRRRGEDLAWYRAQDDVEIAPGQGTPLEDGCDAARYNPDVMTPPAANVLPDAVDVTQPFIGEWAYVQSCGPQHSATLRIEQASALTVRGRWDDGTLARGSSGELVGETRGNQLHLRFCRNDVGNEKDACPRFGPEQSYVAREGDRLVWHQKEQANQYAEYVKLRFVAPGQQPLPENDCKQAQ